ncbi:MAG: nickel insertion protein [Anaerotardibacter sp.]
MQIFLNLSQDATRKTLLDALLSAMTPEQSGEYEEVMSQVSIPEHHHHSIVEVNQTIENLNALEKIKASMKAVYGILAQAEATAHDCRVEETHFHEVGNGSALANAFAICAAFETIGAEKVIATPVQTGCGTVMCAHGEMNIPAPATAAIIATGIVTCSELIPGEHLTPTSAALIRHYVDEYCEYSG